MFPSSGEGGRTHTQLGPLERVNLNNWSSPENLVILSVIHHRPNLLESTFRNLLQVN
jgi:hypothetical protein